MGVVMLLILLTVVFFLLHILPGDPAREMLGEHALPSQVDALRHYLGLDKPLYVQYVDFMTNMFHGNLGSSFYSGETTVNELLYALPCTMELSISALVLSVIIGLPLGMAGALKKGKVPDFVIRIFSLGSFSIPIFWLAVMLQVYVALHTGILPIQGRNSFMLSPPRITGFVTLDSILTGKWSSLIDSLAHLLLPSVAISFFYSAIISRVSRANMIETLREDYILVARAKGLTENKIVYKHAFRNAMLPVFTIIGMQFAELIGGAIVTETVFNLPGMGSLLMQSIFRRDYPVIQGCVAAYAISIVVVTTIVDCIYGFLDPRVSI